MGTSSLNVIDHPNGKVAQLRGVIDGSFDLRALAGEHEIVLCDLEGVTRITSFGVREWRAALGVVRARYLCFISCHPSVVAQFNLVPGFASGGELVSFYLPYVCPACDHIAEVLLDLRADTRVVESLDPPAVSCPMCRAQMEFDDIPASYFKYARSVGRPRPPVAANAMIDDRAPELPRRWLSVRKDVEDTVTAFWLSGALDSRRALRRLTEGVEGQVVVLLGDLDGATDDGLAALIEFLRAVGESYLCRVPLKVLSPLVERLGAEPAPTHIVSVDAALLCPGCGARVELELDAGLLAALRAGGREHARLEQCPSCAHQLGEADVPVAILDAAARMPLATPPEAVEIYLHNRGATPGAPGPSGSRHYTARSQLLFGNYRILRRLGQGGMGEILLARYVGPEKFEKLVVLKRIRADYLSNPSALHEFQREARVAARLSHPNIVQIFDFSRYEDEYFLAMEYVNGIDLRNALRLCRGTRLRWPAPLCMRVISDVCAALEAAHGYEDETGLAVPIIHRDVSPENVIISVDGAVKLTDFGIAKSADSSVNTDAGVFKGKYAYSPPELIEQGVAADQRTDIYAAGIVLYELLCLRRYLGDEPTVTGARAVAALPPPLMATDRDDIPAGLQEIFERATAPDRKARYQTALEFREALEHLMKAGEYPTSHDLAAWIRKVIVLERGPAAPGGGDRTSTSRAPGAGPIGGSRERDDDR